MQILPTSKDIKRVGLPYLLAIGAVVVLWLVVKPATPTLIETTRYVKQVEVKEVIKIVEVTRQENHRVEVTKPDGTHVVSTSTINTSASEQTHSTQTQTIEAKEEVRKEYALHKYNLGIAVDTERDIHVSAGIRLGGLPVFLQFTAVPRKMSGTIGLQLEL